MTSLVHDILKASLISQLKIEQASYQAVGTHNHENLTQYTILEMSKAKIKEIKRQLAVLDNDEKK